MKLLQTELINKTINIDQQDLTITIDRYYNLLIRINNLLIHF